MLAFMISCFLFSFLLGPRRRRQVLDVPMNLKFGSFDDLIRIADDLVKHDMTCEQIVRRLERQGLEIDPSVDLRVIYQRSSSECRL